jgi:hypothetical protein
MTTRRPRSPHSNTVLSQEEALPVGLTVVERKETIKFVALVALASLVLPVGAGNV